MSAPIVSVLLTAYNREEYVAASIESVLAQTCGDFELIVTDDRSLDGTLSIARQYERRDSRVRVHANERNLGDYANRNLAASLARGEFLKFHDSDDVMYPHCLEVMIRYLSAEPMAAFALSAHRAWPGAPSPILSTPYLSYQREFLGFGMFNQGPANALFRTDAFRRLGGFEDLGPHSDLAFWLRACRSVSALLVPADLYWYRVHEGQHLRTSKAGFDQARAARFQWDALNHPGCPLQGVELDAARRNVAFACAKSAFRALKSGRLHLAGAYLRYAGLRAGDWARYLRPPRRVAASGAPPQPVA
jgi:glycosyltransferase involved in cell wall biosynthesis